MLLINNQIINDWMENVLTVACHSFKLAVLAIAYVLCHWLSAQANHMAYSGFFFCVDWSIFRFRFSSYSLSLSFSLVFYLLSPPVHNNISKYLKVSFFVHFIIAASPQPFPHRMWSWSNFIAYVRLHMTCLLSFKRWFTTSACID